MANDPNPTTISGLRRRLSRTGAQLAVMKAMEESSPPYVDQVQRSSGLADGQFAEAVQNLVDANVIRRHSAPHGVLLYPTNRGACEFLQ